MAVFKLCQTINQAVIHHLATCGMSTQVQVLLNWVLITIGLVCARAFCISERVTQADLPQYPQFGDWTKRRVRIHHLAYNQNRSLKIMMERWKCLEHRQLVSM